MVTNTTGKTKPAATEHSDHGAEDERPLLRSFPRPSGYGTHLHTTKNEDASPYTKFTNHLTSDIDVGRADLILIICFFISGLIDAGAYNAYECFTGMQVRNL